MRRAIALILLGTFVLAMTADVQSSTKVDIRPDMDCWRQHVGYNRGIYPVYETVCRDGAKWVPDHVEMRVGTSTLTVHPSDHRYEDGSRICGKVGTKMADQYDSYVKTTPWTHTYTQPIVDEIKCTYEVWPRPSCSVWDCPTTKTMVATIVVTGPTVNVTSHGASVDVTGAVTFRGGVTENTGRLAYVEARLEPPPANRQGWVRATLDGDAWEGEWAVDFDTRYHLNGLTKLVVRAYATDGAVATAERFVRIKNEPWVDAYVAHVEPILTPQPGMAAGVTYGIGGNTAGWVRVVAEVEVDGEWREVAVRQDYLFRQEQVRERFTWNAPVTHWGEWPFRATIEMLDMPEGFPGNERAEGHVYRVFEGTPGFVLGRDLPSP